jgi:hypothetical protein
MARADGHLLLRKTLVADHSPERLSPVEVAKLLCSGGKALKATVAVVINVQEVLLARR